MQQLDDLPVDSQILYLKYIRDFTSLKWFGSLFHGSAPLNSVVFKPTFLFCTCLVQVVTYFLSYMGYLLSEFFFYLK